VFKLELPPVLLGYQQVRGIVRGIVNSPLTNDLAGTNHCIRVRVYKSCHTNVANMVTLISHWAQLASK
jgi:hypothetical protein